MNYAPRGVGKTRGCRATNRPVPRPFPVHPLVTLVTLVNTRSTHTHLVALIALIALIACNCGRVGRVGRMPEVSENRVSCPFPVHPLVTLVNTRCTHPSWRIFTLQARIFLAKRSAC